jgi:hypothetical protein
MGDSPENPRGQQPGESAGCLIDVIALTITVDRSLVAQGKSCGQEAVEAAHLQHALRGVRKLIKFKEKMKGSAPILEGGGAFSTPRLTWKSGASAPRYKLWRTGL